MRGRATKHTIKTVIFSLSIASCAALSGCKAEQVFNAYGAGTLPQTDDQSWEAEYSDVPVAPIGWRTNPVIVLRKFIHGTDYVEDAAVAVDWFRDCAEGGGTIRASDSCLEQANTLWGLR